MYKIIERDGVKAVTYDSLNVTNGTSTRVGGVSPAPWASLSLSTSTGDTLERVEENRQILGDALGMEIQSRIKMDHGIQVVVLDSNSPASLPEADACITKDPNYSLCITTADCVPILFHCPETGAVGLAHAGWKGTVNGIARETALAMKKNFGCPLDKLLAVQGPAIGFCCFEVGAEVAQEFQKRANERGWDESKLVKAIPKTKDKFQVDLHRTNRFWLLEAGLQIANLSTCDLCTACNADLFYSHRRDQGQTGRMMTAIQSTTLD